MGARVPSRVCLLLSVVKSTCPPSLRKMLFHASLEISAGKVVSRCDHFEDTLSSQPGEDAWRVPA